MAAKHKQKSHQYGAPHSPSWETKKKKKTIHLMSISSEEGVEIEDDPDSNNDASQIQ